MWSVDARCDRCKFKETCKERPKLVKGLMSMAHEVNQDEYDESPGDGILIMSCSGFVNK